MHGATLATCAVYDLQRRTFHVTLFLARCIRPFVDALDQVRIFVTFPSCDYYFLLMILAEKTYRFIDAT